MESLSNRDRSGRAAERGFALVVAILALMLLTFLGLTLAATTSTELQIAANHRWSRQAYYNAEAGLELGKRVLMNANWSGILWPPRVAPPIDATNPPNVGVLPNRNDRWGNPSRDLENRGCDSVADAGYGVVLDDGNPVGPYQNITTWPDATGAFGCNPADPGCYTFNGSFTLWVRYRLVADATGQWSEDPDTIILTAEGTAPYANNTTNAATRDFTRANQAVQVLEVALSRFTPSRCGNDSTQAGSDAAGSGMAGCTESPGSLEVQGGTPPPGAGVGGGTAFDDRR